MTITERICLLLHKSSLKQISTIFACLHTAATSTQLRNFGLNSKHDSNKSWRRLTTQQSSVISWQTQLCRSPSLIVSRRVQTQLELITVTFYTILINYKFNGFCTCLFDFPSFHILNPAIFLYIKRCTAKQRCT